MTERSLDVFNRMKESQMKFDYFIVGLSSALFAYLGEKFSPQPISLSSNTIELAALICLAVSVMAGLKRVEFDISHQMGNFIYLDASERRTTTGKTITTGANTLNIDNQSYITQEYLKEHSKNIGKAVELGDKEMRKYENRATIVYRIRNWSLLSGFFLLALSKVFLILYSM